MLSGGEADTTVTYIDPEAPSPVWLPGPPLNVDRAPVGGRGAGLHGGMANSLGKFIYVYGGADALRFTVDSMIRLDVTDFTAGWRRMSLGGDALVRPQRYNGVSATLNNVFFYVAGFDPSKGYALITTTSAYDPLTNYWMTIVPGATLPDKVADSQIGYRGCLVALGNGLYYMRYEHLLRWKLGDQVWTDIITKPPWQNSGAPSCVAYDGKVVQMVGNAAATYDPVTGAFASLNGTGAGSHLFPVAQNVDTTCDPKGTEHVVM